MNYDFEAKAIKPHLRFKVGDVIYLNSDVERKCPMTITRYVLYEDETDYTVSFLDLNNLVDLRYFADKCLMI